MEKYEEGLVSVVIPTYKRSELLEVAINSVLNQTYNNIELLVVNDNTPGDEYSKKLYSLINKYSDQRLRLIEQEKHINGAAARNAGIRAAKGEYIAFLDDDDYWEKEKIEEQVKLLKTLDKSWGAVACLMKLYNDGKLRSVNMPYPDGKILIDILDRRTSMGTGALLIRREALDKSGYFDERLKRNQDLQLFAGLAAKYKIKLDRVYLHNREIKDRQNMPSTKDLVEIKKMYFDSIADILDELTEKEQNIVKIMHSFELSFHYYKDSNYKEFVRHFFRIFRYPTTLYLAGERVTKKVITTKFKHSLERKYAYKR